MGVGVVLVVQLPEQYDNRQINTWRRDLLSAFNPDDFYADGPLVGLTPRNLAGPVPSGQTWMNVNLLLKHNPGGYRRGDGHYVTRIIEWLETTIPGSRVWVGEDSSDLLRPFGADGPTIELCG